jgi:hypothetical protein
LYIDESGTHSYPKKDKNRPAKRYLSLTGVIIENRYYVEVIQPKIREIKLLVASDPDNLPILHREDILNRRGDFIKLRDPVLCKEFDRLVLELLSNHDYVICVVVLDKTEHLKKYGAAAYHPYHYCLNVILEKYTRCLHDLNSIGDVMAEARGGKDDRKLEKEYTKFYRFGTQFRSPEYIQQVLTSEDIKIRRKELGIEGLEIADLLTLANKIDVLHTYGHIDSLDPNFQTKLIRKIQPRYFKNGSIIKGYGKKLLG